MTAEIAILNKSAVALAADSAVTLNINGEKKIYPSANKLFMLSKYHPVGIMVFGNANFMSVSWETIIKHYRQRLGVEKFANLKDYALDFLDFLESSKLFPESEQESFYRNGVYSYFNLIKEDILKEIKKLFEPEQCEVAILPEKKIKEVISSQIKKHCDDLKSKEPIPGTGNIGDDAKLVDDFKNHYNKVIKEGMNEIFEKMPLTNSDKKRLTEIAVNLFFRDITLRSNSGVVISGFGDADIFPCLESLVLEGIALNRLKYIVRKSVGIDFDLRACIMPFAQSEMVCSFMEGIDPNFQKFMIHELMKIFNIYSKSIVKSLSTVQKEEHTENTLIEINNEIIKMYLKGLEKISRENFTNPIINIVASLPKVELAEMAESLVNITRFKRKISSEAETVGGPIDVAVISKDDGFIWIKRKHYFKPELNQHFFYNYYKETENEQKQ